MKNTKLVKLGKSFFLVVISLTFCLMKTSLEMRVGTDWMGFAGIMLHTINIVKYFLNKPYDEVLGAAQLLCFGDNMYLMYHGQRRRK